MSDQKKATKILNKAKLLQFDISKIKSQTNNTNKNSTNSNDLADNMSDLSNESGSDCDNYTLTCNICNRYPCCCPKKKQYENGSNSLKKCFNSIKQTTINIIAELSSVINANLSQTIHLLETTNKKTQKTEKNSVSILEKINKLPAEIFDSKYGLKEICCGFTECKLELIKLHEKECQTQDLIKTIAEWLSSIKNKNNQEISLLKQIKKNVCTDSEFIPESDNDSTINTESKHNSKKHAQHSKDKNKRSINKLDSVLNKIGAPVKHDNDTFDPTDSQASPPLPVCDPNSTLISELDNVQKICLDMKTNTNGITDSLDTLTSHYEHTKHEIKSIQSDIVEIKTSSDTIKDISLPTIGTSLNTMIATLNGISTDIDNVKSTMGDIDTVLGTPPVNTLITDIKTVVENYLVNGTKTGNTAPPISELLVYIAGKLHNTGDWT